MSLQRIAYYEAVIDNTEPSESSPAPAPGHVSDDPPAQRLLLMLGGDDREVICIDDLCVPGEPAE